MANKSPFNVTVSFNDQIVRWVATYEKDGCSFEYVVTDWAVNRFGDKPTLVEEVDEIFSLNFQFFYASQMAARKASTEQKSEAAVA